MQGSVILKVETWNRALTDKYLSEKGYGHIVYIKLFRGLPFIVSITTTQLVSNSYVDFDFKVYNPNDLDDVDYSGIGRRFIREVYGGINGTDIKFTDFDRILIRPVRTREEAILLERYVADIFGLFES